MVEFAHTLFATPWLFVGYAVTLMALGFGASEARSPAIRRRFGIAVVAGCIVLVASIVVTSVL